MKTVRNGRHIDTYIPRELRQMFYRNPNPSAKYAMRNGYDPYGLSTEGLVLYLPLWALKGTAFRSVDAYQTTATVTGTVDWTPAGRDFQGSNDYIELPATATQLNFTTGDFSLIMRVKFDALTGNHMLFSRGLFNDDGYFLWTTALGRPQFYTNQGTPAWQVTQGSDADYTTATWYTIGVSRDGASVKLYKNGVEPTYAEVGVHINPETCARTTKIGIHDDKASNDFDGIGQDVFGYSRALSTAEHLDTHNRLSWRV